MMAKYNVSFYIPAIGDSFSYPLDFTAEEYNKFKKLCKAYAEEEELDSIDLGAFADWCSEEQDDSWFSSIYGDLMSDICAFLVKFTVDGGFGNPGAIILSVFEDFCDENPDFYDEDGILKHTEAAVELFWSQFEDEYEPMFEFEVESL